LLQLKKETAPSEARDIRNAERTEQNVTRKILDGLFSRFADHHT
jgi:hypothetical protein